MAGRWLSSCNGMPDGGRVAVHQDITAHLRTEQQLDETRQFLDPIIENIPIAVVVKDAVTRKFVLVNRTFEAMLKVGRHEVLGKTVFEIYQRQDAERMDASDNEALAGVLGICSNDYEIEMPDGQARVIATSRIVTRDAAGAAGHLVVVIDDITERKKSEQRIAFMAHHDVLTGLANRLVDHGQDRGSDRAASSARRFIRGLVAGPRPLQTCQRYAWPCRWRCIAARNRRSSEGVVAGNRRVGAPGR